MVNKSRDKDLIAFYQANLGDMHSYNASKIFPELANVSLDDIKRLHKDKRQIAKAAGFALNYGGTGFTVANNLGIPIEDGNRVEKAYFEAFPGLKDYYDRCEQDAIEKGYILIDSITGSKFYLSGYDTFTAIHQNMQNKPRDYWLTYRQEKLADTVWYRQQKEEVSYYYRWKGNIRRSALNFPIQGSAASITKLAVVLLYEWIIASHNINIIKIVHTVHDEIMCEVPKEMAKLTSTQLKYFMELAGKEYCPIIPLKAEPIITESWQH